MSSAQFFAFVEGGLDRPFFDRLIAPLCRPRAIKHQVIAVREIPGSAGGKPSLLALFRSFRKGGILQSAKLGKKMVCAFFADKDCDDICRRKLRSAHLFYTSTYDLEGHLFSCGDLQRAIADACGLTMAQAAHAVPDQNVWLQSVAAHWKAWVALCLVSQVGRVNCGCTYDRPSAINPHPLAAPDAMALEAFKQRLATTLGVTRVDFDRLYASTERKIDSAMRAGQPLRYFKGKWLIHALQRHLESIPRVPDASIQSAGEKVSAALIAQVGGHPGCQCCAPFQHGVSDLVAQLA